MDNIITSNNLQATYTDVDVIDVGVKTKEEQDENFSKFLERSQTNLTFNEKKKSALSTNSINFFGYTISHEMFKPHAGRISSLKELSIPKDALRRILGLFSYYSNGYQSFRTILNL